MKKAADLLICRGKILTLDDHDSIFDTTDIAIEKDTILDIGTNLQEKYLCSHHLDASGKLVMPGLINTHIHAAMTLFRGLADDLTLMDWLQNHICPAESRVMNPDNVYLGTLLACLEMIKSGTTTLCDGYFFEAKKIARNHHVPFCIHLSETKQEIEHIERHYEMRPVQHLAHLNILDENVIAAHCVWLSPEEIDLLHHFQVKVVHAPESNMKLASGIAPIPKLVDRGIIVGLGTDGAASNNDLDLFLEMDTAVKLHKVALQDPTALRAKEVVRMATRNGARVLGLEKEIGSLEVGKKADMIMLDLRKPHLIPLYDIYSHLVYTVNGSDVNSVVVNGNILMKDRKFLHLDEDDILDRVIFLAHQIKKD